MSVIAEFTVPSDDLALHHALTAAPEMVVEIERVVATMSDQIMPYFWVSGGDQQEFEDAFRDDDSVTDTTLVDRIEHSFLYRAEWTQNVEAIIYAYTDIGATILQATGRDEEWELQLRFDDREKVSRFQDYCEEHDIRFDLKRLHEEEQPMAAVQYGLTRTQRETLVTALNEGYYDIPQGTTMNDLAAMMNVSQQALSKRLHNGHKSLIKSALTVSHPEDEESAG